MPPRALASMVYFLFFAAIGSLFPYLSLYYQNVGISKQEIGVLIATLTLTTMIASPLWSSIADAFRLHRWMLPLATLGTLIPIALLSRARSFQELLLSVIIYALFVGPVVPLTDNAVLNMLGADREVYGRLRLWGSVGLAASAWVSGQLAERFGMEVMFLGFIIFMLLCSLMSLGLPLSEIKSAEAEPYLRNLRRLFANPLWIGFLLSILLLGICGTFIFNYLIIYVDEMGGGEGLYGLGMAMSGLSEIPIFFASALLIRRLNARGLLMVAFVAYILRAWLISVLPTPETVVLTQLMHGISFAASWSAGVVYVSRIVPPGLGATAQSAMGLAQFSLGGAMGAWLGANLYDVLGAQMTFRVAGLLAGAGLLLFICFEVYAGRRMRLARART